MHPGCTLTQVYLCRHPVDFRKSIDGLSALVEQELELSPFGSALYVFINRQKDKLKALYWHRNGFCLWYKRAEKEKFAWPREGSEPTQVVTMQVRVLRHIRKRYGCPGSEHAPMVATLPAQPLPRSNPSPDLLAMLLTVKFADALSLARFEYVLERAGVAVPRQTLARWVIGAAGVLQPLHNLMRDELFNGSVLHMDETVVQVLKERDRSPTSQSYMWVQTGGPPERPVVVFDYDPGRSGAVPVRLLEGYQGYLMTDGYDGYNAVAKTEGIEHLACMAHYPERGFIWREAGCHQRVRGMSEVRTPHKV